MKLFLILFLLSPVFVYSQFQSGEVIYEVRKLEDSQKEKEQTPIKNSAEEMAQRNLNDISTQVERSLPHLQFKLKFTQNQSSFQAMPVMDSDFGGNIKYATAFMGGSGVFFLDLSKNLLLRQRDFFQETYLISNEIEDRKWEIKNEFMEIAGYRCQKAITTIYMSEKYPEKEVSVWFTPKLPFSFGPNGMTGLPGLILGLERNGYMYYAKEINLSEKEKTINPPSKGKEKTREEFDEYVNEFKKNPMKMMDSYKGE